MVDSPQDSYVIMLLCYYDSPPSYLPLPDSLTPCLTPSLFSLSLSVSLPLSLPLSLSLCLCLSLSLSVSLCLSVCLSVSLSLSLCLSVSGTLCISLSLCVSVCLSVSLSLSLSQRQRQSPAGGEASGLQPSGIDSPALFPLLSPPSLWYRFAYSLSPAIPSLPRDFALLQAFGLRRRPSPLTGLWQQHSLLSLPPSLPGDFALLQALGVGLRPSAFGVGLRP